jgi:hypothetical protein
MPTAQEIDPFLKAHLPARAPKAPWVKSPPVCTKDLTL